MPIRKIQGAERCGFEHCERWLATKGCVFGYTAFWLCDVRECVRQVRFRSSKHQFKRGSLKGGSVVKWRIELGSTLNKCIEHAKHVGNSEHAENSGVNATGAASGAIENALATNVADAANETLEAPETRKVKKSGSTMRSLLCLAMGGFALGFAEFAMMGILPGVAQGMDVSIPYAGNYISAYAVGVCFGTLFLVFGHNISPKKLLVFFAVLMVLGNGMAAIAPNSPALLVARVVAGLPHGAYFGAATLMAKELAEPGKQAQAVSIMVLGQTAANMVGVPFGTLLAEFVSWRAAFAFVAIWAAVACFCLARFVPGTVRIAQTTMTGQFSFLRSPRPWFVLGAVFAGNIGIFCWWSYVSPWFMNLGGFSSQDLPALLMLCGFGMVLGSLAGGRWADKITPGRMAAAGQALSCASLLLIFFVTGPWACAAAAFLCSFAMFSMSSPQQLLMVKVGAGGGEMIGSACVQVAYNAANAIGALVGQSVLNAGAAYNYPSLAGAPFAAIAAVLLLVFALRFEFTADGCRDNSAGRAACAVRTESMPGHAEGAVGRG